MPRLGRIQFPGACYLVALTGNNRQSLFASNQDRRHFLSLLKSHKEHYGLKVYAYSLTAGRADLLIETPRANLSAAMQSLNTRYSKYFNRAHDAVGHVLGGRYKAWVVDKETRLAEASRFVHLSCAREGWKDKPWRCPWTSCAAYVEAGHREPLVDSEAVLREFGQGRLKQSVRYMQFLKERAGVDPDQSLFFEGGVLTGNPRYREELAARDGTPAPRRQFSDEEARRVVAEVAARRGVSEEKIWGRVRWREVAAARREAIHRLWKEGAGVSELARLFSRTPSSVSQIIRAAENN